MPAVDQLTFPKLPEVPRRAVRDCCISQSKSERCMEPIIICPYVHDDDVAQVRRAFKLDEPTGQRLPFFFWRDDKQIGPELAYEHCWNKFPHRDIVIIHTDISPMPEDQHQPMV